MKRDSPLLQNTALPSFHIAKTGTVMLLHIASCMIDTLSDRDGPVVIGVSGKTHNADEFFNLIRVFSSAASENESRSGSIDVVSTRVKATVKYT